MKTLSRLDRTSPCVKVQGKMRFSVGLVMAISLSLASLPNRLVAYMTDDQFALFSAISDFSDGGISKVKELIRKGVLDTHPLNSDGNTPLDQAVYYGNLAAVSVLLETGRAVDVTAQGSGGRTPLHVVAMYGQVGIAEALLGALASRRQLSYALTIQDADGRTPLDLAISSGHHPTMYAIKHASGR